VEFDGETKPQRKTMSSQKVIDQIMTAGDELADSLDKLKFKSPVAVTYNPYRYAKESLRIYIEKFAGSEKTILFMGMNPGPWGMAQTGIPFGEVTAVTNWMGIKTNVKKPETEHPKRIVDGFECKRSEVSGRRLWNLFAQRFKTAQSFFIDHFVVNYCPLMFMEESGRNLPPDKLPAHEAKPLQDICDRHLRALTKALKPDWVIGIGVYAENRALAALGNGQRCGRILHPSPANPQANAGWAERATAQLEGMGAWNGLI
jgi:single-strand selective monofunctional uracil DNA glycosylase